MEIDQQSLINPSTEPADGSMAPEVALGVVDQSIALLPSRPISSHGELLPHVVEQRPTSLDVA